jgi:hypothetical protein
VMKALILSGGTDGEVLFLRAKFSGGRSKEHPNAKESLLYNLLTVDPTKINCSLARKRVGPIRTPESKNAKPIARSH